MGGGEGKGRQRKAPRRGFIRECEVWTKEKSKK